MKFPAFLLPFLLTPLMAADPIHIDGRRELFVDSFLLDAMKGTSLRLAIPRDEGVAFAFDKPWEGPFSGYATILTLPDGRLQAYYRGKQVQDKDGSDSEVTCVAESKDGKTWTKPDLNIYEIMGEKKNNIVLAYAKTSCHNFSPFVDTRADVPKDEKFKALAGTIEGGGLFAWKSEDGLNWQRMSENPVMPNDSISYPWKFDSQNVAFWSSAEKRYVSYYRVFENKVRRIVRSESQDFLTWTPPVLMEYRHPVSKAPIEHLYTNQTHPYFRAPHLYVAIAARFMPGRQVLSDEQAKEIHVDPRYFRDTSDAIFMTTRPNEGGDNLSHYDRTFLEGFIRGGIGIQNWVSRTNYPALNVVPTGASEMSIYVNQDYAQPTSHMRRYSLRTDGFASLHCEYSGGNAVTRPIVFSGKHLSINFSTSAAGGVRIGFEDLDGKPIPGFTMGDGILLIGNEIDRQVHWKSGSDLSALAGKPVRMRISMKDADVYSFQFTE